MYLKHFFNQENIPTSEIDDIENMTRKLFERFSSVFSKNFPQLELE